jgi:hypothetical protein
VLANPLGGAPIGTYDPKTGNVTGPTGAIIGTFDPATGIFRMPDGTSLHVPGFGQASVPTPAAVPVPVPTPAAVPVPASTPAAVPVPASTVLSDTAQMVAALLDAESRSGWNRIEPTVTAWQTARPPLKVDGKFGPKTALTVAQEFGTVPIVRFWPVGSQKETALNAYRAALIELANHTTDPVRANQLRLSAQREQALAFSNHGPLPAIAPGSLISLQRVA